MTKGTVKRWIGDRGYGFIKPDGKKEEIFVHSSDLRGGAFLREGEKVEFNVRETPKGPKAIKVKPSSL